MTGPLADMDRGGPDLGTTFAGYRIEELAGRQRGIGRVHVATHLESERSIEFPPWPVALKVFSPPRGDEAGFRARFEEFARRQAELHHSNVVSVYEVGTDPLPFMSMTLFRGPSLADLIAADALDGYELLAIVRGVAEALDAGAEHGLVYRRLRPSGVLVSADSRRSFLGDFGAGRSPRSTELFEGEDLGTFVDYMSPEEIDGAEPTLASTVYSLGAIAFECLAGEPPFPHEQGSPAMATRVEATPRPLRALRPDLSGGVEGVLSRALQADPLRRHSSPSELAKALERAYPNRARKHRRHDSVGSGTAMPTLRAMPPLVKSAGSAALRSRRIRRTSRTTEALPAEGAGATGGPAVDAAAVAAPAEILRGQTAEQDREHIQSEREAAPTRRLLSPAVLLVGLLIAGAAALGALVAPSGENNETGQIASGPLTLRHPSDWTRTRAVPRLPGLKLTNPVALNEPSDEPSLGGERVLFAGGLERGGDGSLPRELVARLDKAPAPTAVDLGAVQAYKYEALKPRGFSGEANLYVVPTSEASLVVGCVAPDGAAGFMARCERIASTVGLRGVTAGSVGPSSTYARGVERTVTRLNATRDARRARLRAARTPAGQAGNAERLTLAYRAARRSAGRLTPPPGARAVHADIVDSLQRASDAYRGMARAARARSRSRWNSASAAATSAERDLQNALDRLGEHGYKPQPAGA